MKCNFSFVGLSLLVAGCSPRDAKMHEQVTGTWPVAPSGSMTFFPDGSFHFTNSFAVSNTMLAFCSDGTWNVRDGFLITTVTNSIAKGTDEKPQIGMTSRGKINLIDEHNLCYGDESSGIAYHR